MSSSKLNFYSVFHLNLMFSSIRKEEREKVIQNCYWPLMQLADQGTKIAIESTGLTLELIEEISPEWIKQLKSRIASGLIEFVGSGYSQIIGPLVPATINSWNQQIGLNVYMKLLGIKPGIALVNEMAYSGGMVQLYQDESYKAIIMEWNNPRLGHPEWEAEWQYYPQRVIGTNAEISLPIIWANSIAFQKFQRYVHGEYNLDDYIEYLKLHLGNGSRNFPLYSNDVEIFNFRPGRYQTESDIEGRSEWDRIFNLYCYLAKEKWCEYVFPSEVLVGNDSHFAGNSISLETPAQPIPVKKQQKYNINRWSITGRNDLAINTQCYTIYKELSRSPKATVEDWRQLCYLWSSDFRTHIAESRWNTYQREIGAFAKKWAKPELTSETQCTSVIDLPYKRNTLCVEKMGSIVDISNACLSVQMETKKGMTIKSCIFKKFSSEPLFGTIVHGYFDDISLGADFYTGHSIIEHPGAHKISDLAPVEAIISENNNQIELHASVVSSEIKIETVIGISKNSISIHKKLTLPRRSVGIIHPFHLTLMPSAWDKQSLYYSTCNGGREPEVFKLGLASIRHKNLYSTSISAVDGLGCTNGILRIGDKSKNLLLKHDLATSYVSPRIVYEPVQNNSFLLRVIYSAQEIDETFHPDSGPVQIDYSLNIEIEVH